MAAAVARASGDQPRFIRVDDCGRGETFLHGRDASRAVPLCDRRREPPGRKEAAEALKVCSRTESPRNLRRSDCPASGSAGCDASAAPGGFGSAYVVLRDSLLSDLPAQLSAP